MSDGHRGRGLRLRARLWSDRSLAGRLLLAQGIVLVMAMVAVVLAVTVTFAGQSMSNVESGLSDDIKEFTNAAVTRPASQSLADFAASYLTRQPFERGTFMIAQITGSPVQGSLGSASLQADPGVLALLANPPTIATYGDLAAGSVQYRVRASAIMSGSQTVGAVVALTDLSTVADQTRNVTVLTAFEAGAAILLAIVTTFTVLRRVLGVVGDVTRTASVYTIDSPGRRLEGRFANDEIGRLVNTFNDMLGRLEAASQAQRQLLSDVSHQLRTPLTVMRGHLEVARRTGLDDPTETGETIDLVLDEIDHASVLVDRVLVLGRSLEPDFVQPEPVDLPSFLGDVATAARAIAERHWELGPVPDLVVSIDREKVRGAVLNLIDNSVKATGPEGTIRIGAETGPGGTLAIVVADTGVGIPVAQHERIFRRFERGERLDERGSGLGLAIVSAVAEAHGGQVTIDSASGAGCTVRIVLPASRILPGGSAGGRAALAAEVKA